jgi:hypothetical protein
MSATLTRSIGLLVRMVTAVQNDSESFEEQVPEEPRKALVRRVMAAGANAPNVLLEAAIKANGQWAANYAQGVQTETRQASTEELISRAIKAHTILARSEGAGLGLAITAAEMTSVIGTAGTLTPATAAVGLAGDLVGLAWIQTRMVLVIAALSGHDPMDSARYKEMLSLMGLYGAPQADLAAKHAGKGAERVLKRLILRHLKGDNLKAVKALFDVVGIKFTRTGVLKVLPGVNVPISAVVNGRATSLLGAKARVYYATLPGS